MIDYFKNINQFLNHFYKTFYKLDYEKLEQMHKMKIELDKNTKQFYKKANKDQMNIMSYLNKIKQDIYEMNGSLMINSFS